MCPEYSQQGWGVATAQALTWSPTKAVIDATLTLLIFEQPRPCFRRHPPPTTWIMVAKRIFEDNAAGGSCGDSNFVPNVDVSLVA